MVGGACTVRKYLHIALRSEKKYHTSIYVGGRAHVNYEVAHLSQKSFPIKNRPSAVPERENHDDDLPQNPPIRRGQRPKTSC